VEFQNTRTTLTSFGIREICQKSGHGVEWVKTYKRSRNLPYKVSSPMMMMCSLMLLFKVTVSQEMWAQLRHRASIRPTVNYEPPTLFKIF
jgi:hypothetical protein